jgi:hypothetical protein
VKSRLRTHHRLQITDQLFKSNLTFCVVSVFTLQNVWCVHNRLFNAYFDDKFSSTPTLRRNLNKPSIFSYFQVFRFADNTNKFSNWIVLVQFFTSAMSIGITMFQLTTVRVTFRVNPQKRYIRSKIVN